MARVEHFAYWAETTHPPLFFWLAAYTFPTGFLTAVLQVKFVNKLLYRLLPPNVLKRVPNIFSSLIFTIRIIKTGSRFLYRMIHGG